MPVGYWNIVINHNADQKIAHSRVKKEFFCIKDPNLLCTLQYNPGNLKKETKKCHAFGILKGNDRFIQIKLHSHTKYTLHRTN
jgi:hypothetical protein